MKANIQTNPRFCVHAQRGQALVEFALVIPIIVVILVGAVDLGRGIYSYNVVGNAAREGARYGAVAPTNKSGIKSRILETAVAVEINPAMITAPCSDEPDCKPDSTITVTVPYRYYPITPFFAPLNFTAVATMTIE